MSAAAHMLHALPIQADYYSPALLPSFSPTAAFRYFHFTTPSADVSCRQTAFASFAHCRRFLRRHATESATRTTSSSNVHTFFFFLPPFSISPRSRARAAECSRPSSPITRAVAHLLKKSGTSVTCFAIRPPAASSGSSPRYHHCGLRM